MGSDAIVITKYTLALSTNAEGTFITPHIAVERAQDKTDVGITAMTNSLTETAAYFFSL